MVRALLESHANANARSENGSTALHIACASSIEPHVALLIAHRADVNATDGHGAPPLMQLVATSNLETVTDERRIACLQLLGGTGTLEVCQRDPSGSRLVTLRGLC